MNKLNKLQQYVEKLPEPLQAEVLDFVEYLLTKLERNNGEREEPGWSKLSLAFAMRGMESEVNPSYTRGDLREVFS